ncbi:MAG: hypothetical protein ACYC3I_02740 [Gemmataceae bacterium]
MSSPCRTGPPRLRSLFYRWRPCGRRWKELTRRRDDIEPELRHFLESKPTLEAPRRIEAILASPRPVPSADTLRTLRAIRVLEVIGTAKAQDLLRKLASGAAGARQTREAKSALQRLRHAK